MTAAGGGEDGDTGPGEVVRTALQNAVSLAGMLFLAEATPTGLPERPTEHPATAPPGM